MIMRKARTSLAVVAVFFAIGTANAQSQNVPDNASVRGNNWFCNSGYQRNGNECVVLSEEEQALVELQRQALILQNAGRSREIDGQSFSIRDIERRCEAYKYSNTYGDIECRGSELRRASRFRRRQRRGTDEGPAAVEVCGARYPHRVPQSRGPVCKQCIHGIARKPV